MELKIYNRQGKFKTSVSPSDSDRHVKEIMNDNILNLSFTLYEYVELSANDYVDFEGERFTLLEDYKPEQKSTVEYVYNCKFYGIESELKKAKVLKMVDGDNELTFSYDATAAEHLQLVCDNINRIKGSKNWVIGEVVSSANINIEYDNIFCFDALSEIAKNFNTEWWIEGTTINLSRCEHGTPVTLGYEMGLLKLSRVTNETVPYFTRLYPIGSTRNIVASDYGHRRLQLPCGVRYIERNIHLGVVEQAEKAAFAHIYPKRIGTVSSVKSEEVTGEDQKSFTIYYFKDDKLNFDPNAYEIGGLTKQVSFQSGELNGRDFEVNFNSKTKEFEIITQFPYENQQLPGDLLIPKQGDKYVLWNIRMPKEYYPLAEKEFENACHEYLKKISIDTSIYKAPTDYIYLDENHIKLTLGRRVLLKNDVYFPSGQHESRVTKISRRVIRPTDMDIECSYAVDFGRMNHIESSIVDMQAAYKEQLNKDMLTVLKSWDSIDPSEYNVLSSVRTIRTITNQLSKLAKEIEKKYLHKDIPDTAKYLITFLRGINVKETADIMQQIIRKYISSDKFVSGFLGEGFRIWQNAQNEWCGELDRLTVRKTFYVFELIVQRILHQGGMVIRSAAGGKLTKVTDKGSYWRCEHDSTDDFDTNDQVICQTFTGVSLKRYWRLVTSAGQGYFNLSKADCENGSDAPAVGDEVAVLGNRTNPARQKAQIDCAVGLDAPYRDDYAGINSYSLTGKLVTRTGNLTGITDPDFGVLSGNGLYSQNAYLKGTLCLKNGKTVETAIQDGVESIVVGGRNLLSKSKPTSPISNSNYLIARFYLASIPVEGQEYTISIKGQLEANRTHFGIFNTGGMITLTTIKANSYANGIYSRTFKWKNSGNNTTVEPKYINIYQYPNGGTSKSTIEWIKLEAGNKATDWTPAPEDADTRMTEIETNFEIREGQISSKVAQAETYAARADNSAAQAAGSANQAAAKLVTITQKETGITQTAEQINQKASQTETCAAQAAAKLAAITQKETNINQTASQINLTASQVTTKANEASKAATLAMAMSKGKMLYRDPTFAKGVNNIILYTSGMQGISNITRQTNIVDNPNGSSAYCLKLEYNASDTFNKGGFTFKTASRANAVFVVRFVGLFPNHVTLKFTSNAYGTGATSYWLTDNKGTGKYEEYAYIIRCGSDGTFSTTAFVYAQSKNKSAFWARICYATVFDMTDVDDIPTREEMSSELKVLSDQISSKVSSVTFNALTGRVGKAETNIVQMSNEISQKASATEVNGINTRLKTAEQKITPDSIKMTVKEQTNQIVDASISDINGVNLLQNTALVINTDGWSVGFNGLKNVQRDPDMTYEGRCSLYMSIYGQDKPGFASVQHSNDYTTAKPGDMFTASVYVRKSATDSIDKGLYLRIMFYKADGSYSKFFTQTITPSKNDTWERFTLTATAPAETVKAAYRLTIVQNGGFWANGMMLVRGSKSIGWSQSPMDCPTTDQVKSEFILDGNGISLFGKKLSLNGVVTFSSLAADAQGKINAAQSTASSAQTKADNAQAAANTAQTAANSAKAAANTAQQTANTAMTQKIGLARLDKTIIDGGYIKTTLIHADELVVSHLSGADGTFRKLNCIDQQGNTVASLAFNAYGTGCIAVENGDLFMQGTKDNRSLRFYSSDLWCRGLFGSRSRTLVEVNGTTAYYYSKGLSGAKVSLSLPPKIYNGETYYLIPCFGSSDLNLGDANGMPVDTIVFTSKTSANYKYDVNLHQTQRVLLFNANDNYSNIEIYTNGNKKTLSGGEAVFAQNLRQFLYPSPNVNQPGAGIVFCSSYDNDYK
ncbi:hypothetical protein [Phocaeicola oris]|uniref:hypothetical protein n=1 Tax=Phocaeicola oris TaxID=2896850 RepID=UPI00234F71D8|nr:hypothetical protein [Phocaeicola oris]MCE2616112.1 hypothetical protein [Phocaeicola oris]